MAKKERKIILSICKKKNMIKNKNIEIIINTLHLLFTISFKREPLAVVSKRSN